jgi:DNA-binding GntR family transcriptional regulator
MQGQILSGSIPAGTALPETSVAEMFDVARPTAKAAIEQLVHIGLLRRLRNKTARVPLLREVDVADLYLSRSIVESGVARLLAERGEVPAGAAEALDRFRAVINSGDKIAELVQCDIDFHRALADATGSPRLQRLHELVIGEAHLCMAQVQTNHLLDPQIIADEHARILSMIRTRNVDMAAYEMNAHIHRARAMLVSYLKRQEVDVINDRRSDDGVPRPGEKLLT